MERKLELTKGNLPVWNKYVLNLSEVGLRQAITMLVSDDAEETNKQHLLKSAFEFEAMYPTKAGDQK